MSNTNNKSDFIDLGAILNACRKKWYVFVICVFCTVGIAAVYIRKHNPEYMVCANMMITSDKASGGMMEGLSSLFGSGANVDDELFAVSSHSVLRDVVKKLNLNKHHITKTGFLKSRFDYKGFPIDVLYHPALTDTLRTTLVFTVKVNDEGKVNVKMDARGETVVKIKDAKFPVAVKSPFGEFTIVSTPELPTDEATKETIILYGYDKAAEILADDLSIYIPSRRADVIAMNLVSENTSYATDVLNSLIELYNLRSIRMDNNKNQKTLDFLNERLALLTDDLSEVEGNIENLKSKQGIVDLEAEVQYQFVKKGQLESELVAEETKHEILKLIRDFLTDPDNALSLVPAGLVSQSQGDGGGQAINSYNELLLQRMRIASTAQPGNAALKTIDGQLAAMRTNLVTTLSKSLETSQLALNELRGKFGSTNASLGHVPNQERVMRDILRQREIKEQIYIFLLKEREQIAMLLANGNEKGKVIDEAYALTESVGMSKKMIIAIAGFLGVLLALLIIYMQNVLRTKFATKDELSSLTSAPVLGEISLSRSGEVLVVKPKTTSSTAELFRLVRSNLLFILGDPSNKVVLMTSTKSGEGKSFISINIAASLAMLGKKVLLVGLDIRKPRLAEYLNMPPTPGFTTYIAGGSQQGLDKIVHKDALLPGMDIIFAGPVPPNPSELLVSDKVDEFFKTMREHYDYIIIDSAPVGMVSDSLALARVADATVYVCRANYTTKSDIRLFTDLYDNKRLPKVGLVLNGTTAKQGYGYGYGEKD